MKITKYPQSCLVIQTDTARIIIDPGSFVAEKYSINDLGKVDAILITHEHADHADSELINQLVAGGNVEVIANASAAALLGSVVTHIIEDGGDIEIAGVRVVAREIPHVAMVNGSPGPQNTGYVINNILFHPGDGIEASGIKTSVVAAPIAGPDISPRDVYTFVKATGARTVIPIHYNYHKADPDLFTRLLGDLGVETIVLADTESVEV